MTTLTYQPDQGNPEFNEDELDSMQVGEQMLAEQQQQLAGKFQSAEELEKAYLELQQRFSAGERGEEPQEEFPTEEPQAEQEVYGQVDQDLMESIWEEAQGEWTEETLNRLREADPVDIAQAYLEYRNENQQRVLTQDETDSLYNIVGGESEYNDMLRWAAGNLDEQNIQLFDSVINKGDPASCYFAVQALAFRMAEMEGWTPEDFTTGGNSRQVADVFQSQAQVVEAMNDPRYDRDPAYRQEVMNKLERSSDLIY